MIQNTHESIPGAVGRRVSFSQKGNTWENILFRSVSLETRTRIFCQ